jgi:anhydro-N-acetylmuramic acid kinase
MAVTRAIGLMSGTSLDGIDVALVETDGELVERLGPTGYRAYGDQDRAVLHDALADVVQIASRGDRPGRSREAEELVTRLHAEAVEGFLRDRQIAAETIDVVGFHGQTILHRPGARLTVQLGDGDALARRLGIPVVYDFRAADMEAGGQGAPLVPVFHRALASAAGLDIPIAVLNLGGVANVTLVGADDQLVAFDTGPGNALIDDWMREQTGRAFDEDGRCAAGGRADEALLAELLADPFFRQPPPKSLDRNRFSHRLVARHPGGLYGAGRGARRRLHAGGADALDCRGRRGPQPRAIAAPWRATHSAAGDGRHDRLVGRVPGSAGVCLPGRAQPQRAAAHVSRHDRRAGADDRRRARETLRPYAAASTLPSFLSR